MLRLRPLAVPSSSSPASSGASRPATCTTPRAAAAATLADDAKAGRSAAAAACASSAAVPPRHNAASVSSTQPGRTEPVGMVSVSENNAPPGATAARSASDGKAAGVRMAGSLMCTVWPCIADAAAAAAAAAASSARAAAAPAAPARGAAPGLALVSTSSAAPAVVAVGACSSSQDATSPRPEAARAGGCGLSAVPPCASPGVPRRRFDRRRALWDAKAAAHECFAPSKSGNGCSRLHLRPPQWQRGRCTISAASKVACSACQRTFGKTACASRRRAAPHQRACAPSKALADPASVSAARCLAAGLQRCAMLCSRSPGPQNRSGDERAATRRAPHRLRWL